MNSNVSVGISEKPNAIYDRARTKAAGNGSCDPMTPFSKSDCGNALNARGNAACYKPMARGNEEVCTLAGRDTAGLGSPVRVHRMSKRTITLHRQSKAYRDEAQVMSAAS